MTYKQIEASREARLWLSQIVIPTVGIVMMVPETRKVVTDKFREAKSYLKNEFQKRKGSGSN